MSATSVSPPKGSLKRGNAIIHRRPLENGPPNEPCAPLKNYSDSGAAERKDAILESINQLTILLQQLENPQTIVLSQAEDPSLNYRKFPLSGPLNDKTSNLSVARELDDLLLSLEQMKCGRATPTNDSLPYPPSASSSLNRGNRFKVQRDFDELLNVLRSEMHNHCPVTCPTSDNATGFKEVCCACGKPLVGEFLSAMGKLWHQEHFTCKACGEMLSTQNFYERDEDAFCEPCHQMHFSPKCAYCDQAILDKCLTAMGQTWHPEHFFCTSCQCFFDENVGFHERNSKPYCPDCFYSLFGLKCTKCKKPITSQYVSALDSYWHHQCFVCQECHQPFANGSFYEVDGLPYCEPHYHAKRGSLCHACKQPVTGGCINAMGRKYHPHHFVCTFCRRELNKGTFKEYKDHPYCQECFIKCFS